MHIDCDGCEMRGLRCGDCVVSVMLGAPPEGVELDESERAALAALAAWCRRCSSCPARPTGPGPGEAAPSWAQTAIVAAGGPRRAAAAPDRRLGRVCWHSRRCRAPGGLAGGCDPQRRPSAVAGGGGERCCGLGRGCSAAGRGGRHARPRLGGRGGAAGRLARSTGGGCRCRIHRRPQAAAGHQLCRVVHALADRSRRRPASRADASGDRRCVRSRPQPAGLARRGGGGVDSVAQRGLGRRAGGAGADTARPGSPPASVAGQLRRPQPRCGRRRGGLFQRLARRARDRAPG